VEEIDGLVEMEHLNRRAERKARESMHIGGLVNWFTGFLSDYLNSKSERRAHAAYKCDGEHPEPPCRDPQCWRRS
jgi:hypothetical protein